MSRRGDILDAIATIEKGTNGIGNRCYRSRALSIPREKLPAMKVRPVSETVTEPTTAGSDRVLNVAVEYHVRGDTTDAEAEPIIASGHALLMADPTLGGLAIDIGEIGTEWELDDGDGDAGKITVTYAVLYRTARNAT